MAAVRLLRISDTLGTPLEHTLTGDITFASFNVNGGGPVLNASGLDMNSTSISDVKLISFSNPATDGILQTAGSLAADNIMAKERDNVMSTTGAILFGAISDLGGQVDSFKLPALSGAPSASPSFSTASGYLVYDQTNKLLNLWDSTDGWITNFATASTTPKVTDMTTFVAGATVAVNDVVYISADGAISPADASAEGTSRVIGFALTAGDPGTTITVQSVGMVTGFAGLTPGGRYLLSESPGAVALAVNSSAPSTIVQCGFAANSTTINILLQYLGQRNA